MKGNKYVEEQQVKRGRRSRDEAKKDGQSSEKISSEWKEKVVQIRRVTKVVKGGKKLSFRAVVVVGNGSPNGLNLFPNAIVSASTEETNTINPSKFA